MPKPRKIFSTTLPQDYLMNTPPKKANTFEHAYYTAAAAKKHGEIIKAEPLMMSPTTNLRLLASITAKYESLTTKPIDHHSPVKDMSDKQPTMQIEEYKISEEGEEVEESINQPKTEEDECFPMDRQIFDECEISSGPTVVIDSEDFGVYAPFSSNKVKKSSVDQQKKKPATSNETVPFKPPPSWTCRKEKSLGLLCRKFLIHVGNSIGSEINLDQITNVLGCGKRRMYDIINVLESLWAVIKITKSRYRWLGFSHLPNYLEALQALGLKNGWDEKIARMERRLEKSDDRSIPRCVQLVAVSQKHRITLDDNLDMDLLTVSDEDLELNGASPQRTSLISLARRFFMLLLSTPYPYKMSMDVASALLVDSSSSALERELLARTRCRRMYDIANVLIGLGLISKQYQVQHGRKVPILCFCRPFEQVKARRHENVVEQSENAASFADILKAAEIERERMKDQESSDYSSWDGSLPSSQSTTLSDMDVPSPIGVQEDKCVDDAENMSDGLSKKPTVIRNLHIITKNGSKFVLKVKSMSLNAEQKMIVNLTSVGVKRELDASLGDVVLCKKVKF